jgi:mono/diheme cytochrome c family protein
MRKASRMNLQRTASALLALTACLGMAACQEQVATGEQDVAAVIHAVQIPANLAPGEASFEANCAVCHGTRALGTEQGPPLVHIIYEPSHHSDLAFYMAAERGVRAHHWNFGDMPAIPWVTREEVGQIVAYIRFLQRQVGIN